MLPQTGPGLHFFYSFPQMNIDKRQPPEQSLIIGSMIEHTQLYSVKFRCIVVDANSQSMNSLEISENQAQRHTIQLTARCARQTDHQSIDRFVIGKIPGNICRKQGSYEAVYDFGAGEHANFYSVDFFRIYTKR